jgi:sirohydrochlorin ferrochelatase
MKSLLIVAHGSRRAASNEEVIKLADAIRQHPALEYDDVGVGFLELAEPSIPEGIEACFRRGAKEVVIFPYFLAAGRHVVTDIPEIVDDYRASHPEANIIISPHLGASTMLPEAILDATNT